ncbi:putative Jerky protein-like 65 [Homarus americanus]|uniref:Putative Jerky protein-like 65 n=1 Tax=Homarus americanus TaxID=6706 RepID=A0A8J5N2E1_HOMAM|nr:putative Jerky protein-like 65 [Homarus americanus]
MIAQPTLGGTRTLKNIKDYIRDAVFNLRAAWGKIMEMTLRNRWKKLLNGGGAAAETVLLQEDADFEGFKNLWEMRAIDTDKLQKRTKKKQHKIGDYYSKVHTPVPRCPSAVSYGSLASTSSDSVSGPNSQPSTSDIAHYSTGFTVSKEKHLIHELLAYVKDVTNPDAKELSSGVNEDVLTEWLDVDDNVPTAHHYTDSEIVDMVKSPERNACTGSDEDENSEENEEDVRDRISIDRLITLTTELLAGLEQRSFVNEQEIMNVFLLQDKLIRERPKYMKQQTLHDILKKIARKQEATVVSTLDNPLPSTSRQVEAVPVAEDVVTVNDKDDNPDSPSAV